AARRAARLVAGAARPRRPPSPPRPARQGDRRLPSPDRRLVFRPPARSRAAGAGVHPGVGPAAGRGRRRVPPDRRGVSRQRLRAGGAPSRRSPRGRRPRAGLINAFSERRLSSDAEGGFTPPEALVDEAAGARTPNMKRRTAWVLVAGVAAVAIGAAAVGGLALALRGRGTGWSANNYLYLDLQGEIPEEPPSSDLGTIFERQPPSLRTLVESLERAADDPRVSAVVLRVSILPDAGWATVQELRDAVGRFRRSGKPAYAHLEFCGNKEYYLASGCDKIFALPSAIVELTGLRSEV